MTNLPPNPPPEPSESQPPLWQRLANFIKKPSTLVVGGVLLSLGVVTYGGVNYFVYQKLSPLLSAQLSNLLEREVRVGKVKGFSLNQIRIGTSVIPTTTDDPDSAKIEEITIGFNLLPILIGKPLNLDIVIDDPNLYLEQEQSGQWVKLPEFEGEGELNLPIDIKANIELNDADITLLPNGFQEAVTIEAVGKGGYIYKSNEDQSILYDLDIDLLNSAVALQGESNIKTWQTDADLRINQLALPKLAALLPNLPVAINSGLIDSNLAISLPALAEIEETEGTGNFDISNLEGQVKPLKAPLKLDLGLKFQGETVQFENTQISLGDVVTQIQGSLNWEEGYDINIDLNPFGLQELLTIIPTKSSINLGGEIQGKIRVTGEIKDPVVTGTINNTKPLLIAQTPIEEFKTVFQANLNKVNLKELRIQPTAGGRIVATGNVQPGILKALEENKPINWQKMPVSLGFQAQLPGQELVDPYYQSPQNVSFGTLFSQGNIQGTLGNPKGKIEWLAPDAANVSGKQISGQGTILLTGENILIRDTRLNSNGGNITLKGTGNLERKQWQTLVTADQFALTPFVQIACSLITCPEPITQQPITLSNANLNLSGKLDDFTLESLKSRGNLTLNVDQGTIALDTNLSDGNLNATARVSGLALDPYLPNITAPITVTGTNLNLSGSLAQILQGGTLNINPLDVDGNVRLTVAGSPINANLELSNGIIETTANVGRVALNPLIPNLPVQSSVINSNVTLTGNLNALLASLGNTPDLSSFQGRADLALTVDGSQVNASGRLDNGTVRGVADISQLSLNDLIPNLPIAAEVVGGEVTVSSQISPLLSPTPDLSSAQAIVDLQLAAAQGTIDTVTRLQNNQWTTQVDASNLNPSVILSQLVPDAPSIDIKDLDAQATLSGSLRTLFEDGGTLPIQAQNITVQADGQRLEARGDILISNLLTRPDAQVNLAVEARSNLDNLPLTELISVIPLDRRLLPEELQLEGTANFDGQLIGQNLLTAPTVPGNIRLLGDLTLRNFAFNERDFESVLTGNINATLGGAIALNLRGAEDVIAATLQPCTRADCPAPYLPTSVELRQIAGEEPPIIVTGTQRGDEFVANIQQFPLGIFKIAPGQDLGIPGFLSGIVETEISINPYTLEGRGRLTIEQPSLGFIEAEQITADLVYQDNIIRLSNAALRLGQSLYALQGSLNLNTGAIDGRLNVDQGQVQDLLIALKISNIERLIALLQLQPIDYAEAAEIPPQSVGTMSETIAEKVNLLAVIEQEIRELARQRQTGGIPTELDIRGLFDTEIALGGTIYNPRLDIELTGRSWEWHPQEPYPDIVEPLGLVIRDEEFIPINRIVLDATVVDNTVTINPARLQIKDTILALNGQFSLQQVAANWQVDNLSLDTVNNFFRVPLDASGALDASGTISGSPFNPQVQGQFALVDLGFQGKPLNETVAGQFTYQDARFNLATDETSIVNASVSIPFPTYADNNQFSIDILLDTEALKLVSILTREQVLLTSGEGEIRAQARGRLDLSQGLLITELDAGGLVTLNNTVFQSAALPEPLTVSGQIAIDDTVINVQQLQGSFADSQLNIAGILPLFQPQTGIENPLTVAIEQGQINLEGLYSGQVDGLINVTGTALQPVVGGNVRLANGQVFIPDIASDNQAETVATINKWVNPRSRQVASRNQPALFMPQLQSFDVTLESLFVESLPLFRFDFGGNITLNGPLANLEAIQPDGVITVNRGLINFLDTRFFIERRNENQIVFIPDQGLLNPVLDLQLRTIVSEVSGVTRISRAAEVTEIPDDSLTKVRRIDVNLALDGSLAQLVPSLGQDESEVCRIQDPLKPIQGTAILSDEELERVSECLQVLAAQGATGEQLLSNPVIELTSSPPRSQGQIVRLLSEQFFVLAEALQGQNTEQLIQFGIVQLALPMVFQTIIYDIETAVSETIDSTDFRIVPFLEAIYEVEDQGYVRLSYDYSFNEFRVIYEERF